MEPEERFVLNAQFSVDDLGAKLDELWAELQRENSTVRKDADGLGIDLTLIDGVRRDDAILLRREGAGLDPATTAVIVAFAPVAAKIAKDLWDHVLLPRILRAWGADAAKKN